MLISIAATGWLVWMQGRALKRETSMAVEADRAHYAADLAANAVVLIGVISGAFLAAPGLDAAAGLVVAVWLFWGAVGVLRTAADHLVDKALPESDRAAIASTVLSDPRVTGVHQLRTRMSGPTPVIQMHVDLDPALTLEAAHDIMAAAEARLLARWPGANILIHPDPRGRPAPQPASEPLLDAAPAEPPVKKGPWS